MSAITDKAAVLFLQNLTERGVRTGIAYPSWANGKPIAVIKEHEVPTKAVRAAWADALDEATHQRTS